MLSRHPVRKRNVHTPIGFSRVCKLANVRYVFMGSYPRARVQGEWSPCELPPWKEEKFKSSRLAVENVSGLNHESFFTLANKHASPGCSFAEARGRYLWKKRKRRRVWPFNSAYETRVHCRRKDGEFRCRCSPDRLLYDRTRNRLIYV